MKQKRKGSEKKKRANKKKASKEKMEKEKISCLAKKRHAFEKRRFPTFL